MVSQNNKHRLVLGGARSGKSSYALQQSELLGKKRLYLATAQALDPEMEERVALHQAERGAGWRTTEEPISLGNVLEKETGSDVILIDCLTMWLSNLMLDGYDVDVEIAQLLLVLEVCSCPVIMVSNEVGFSLVPESALGREFRDAQGILNQKIAEFVSNVDLVVAGLPMPLKQV